MNTSKTEAGSSVNELAMSNINFKAEMGKKICSQNREGTVSTYEYPSETTAKFDIHGHGFFTNSRDGRFVDRLENHGSRFTFFSSRRGKNSDISTSINEETSTSSTVGDVK